MPGTARGLGVRDAYNTTENLWGTVRLIRGHLDKYSNSSIGGGKYDELVLALAAYNAGGGAVKRHDGVPPYKETQNYIKKVTAWYNRLCGNE
jgi:soluble lytic murein transglycosylase-like protein